MGTAQSPLSCKGRHYLHPLPCSTIPPCLCGLQGVLCSTASFGQSLQSDLVGLEDAELCALAGLLNLSCADETDSDSSEDSEDSQSSFEDDSDWESDAFKDADEVWCSADTDVTINPTCDCCIRDSYTHGSLTTCGNSVASEFGNSQRFNTCASPSTH